MFKKCRSFVALVMVVGLYGTADAQLATRCRLDDQLGGTDAKGRNAWSRKCGYISATREGLLNEEGEYQVYDRSCAAWPVIPSGSDCQRRVPVSETEPCITGLVKLGTCVAGCYTPTQRMSFNNRYTSIAKAAGAGLPSVTALSPTSTRGNLRYTEQPIKTFVRGDTEEDIFVLETATGMRLEVTSEHPMVNDRGEIVRAKTLRVGDKLMARDGTTVALSRVSVFKFRGAVWNVKPISERKQDNILDAEGFLTGSVRFQNEWANESYRLSLRDELDASGL